MTISSAIEQAARIVWRHKVLAAMGILDIILTDSGLAQLVILSPAISNPLTLLMRTVPQSPINVGLLGELYRAVSPYGAAGWAVVIGGIVLVLIVLAVLGLVIEGGLIATVDGAIDEKPVGVRGVFTAGWRRILPMVIIASVPAIPLTAGAALSVGIGTGIVQNAGGLSALNASPALAQQTLGVVALIGLGILCPLGLVTLPLTLLGVMAYRACMLENLNTIGSFQRAWSVLRQNPGPVLALMAVSYGVSLLANAVASVPSILASLFLPVVVLLWLIDGIARTYYLALWTVGWRIMTIENQTGRDIASG